ncbi:fasciclin domain-containing protein [Sphingosinithalassobacter portus]|uniref:fasciclin domain-containing protein n=1 Tax=Stakelama portus TaxID=2676234 RepID=UPI00137B6FBE|nr:fasciclin domain-containing protein [Sphingosinithalassobacter portus]
MNDKEGKPMRGMIAPVMAIGLMLSACTDGGDAKRSDALTPSDRTVAVALDQIDTLDRTGALVKSSGLEDVLDGIGPYTVFAPNDAAYAAIGQDAAALDSKSEGAGALAAALLRAHIVPGLLTDQDIANAIKANGGSVEMTTMDDNILTFRKEGDAIIVSAPDGATAHLLPGTEVAKNGAVHPIDALLRSTGEGAGETARD